MAKAKGSARGAGNRRRGGAAAKRASTAAGSAGQDLNSRALSNPQMGTVQRRNGKRINVATSMKDGVTIKKNLDRMPGVKFYDRNGKRVSRAKAATAKGHLRSGFAARWRNPGRSGTKLQELVGGGSSG